MVLLAWPGALAIGLSLGMLGSGGSILTVPVLIYLLGLNEKLAIASSLAIVGIIAAAAALPYLKERQIQWRSVVLFGIPGMMGTYFGAWAANFVSANIQLMVFAAVMLAAAVFMLRPPDLERSTTGQRSAVKITGDGLLIGALTGFVGVGGGFLVVPALVILGGLTIHHAVATSLVIIALKSATGFYKYTDIIAQHNLTIDWGLIGLIASIGVLGSFIGSHWGSRISQQKLQTVFGCCLILMSAFILMSSGQALFT